MTKGAEDQSFIWGTGLLSGAGSDASTSTFYYLQDHLGSPVRLLGQDSNQETLAYDEFGVLEVGAASGMGGFGNPFGFTGYQRDGISDLWYAQARYYNPGAGRFAAEDPIRDKFNWYGYCGGNPIGFTDPSGLIFGLIGRGRNNSSDDCPQMGSVVNILDVPFFNQNDTPTTKANNLCWATSTAMIVAFYLEDEVDRTLDIALHVANSTGTYYNQPRRWVSSDNVGIDGITLRQRQSPGTLTEREIRAEIAAENPFGVLYRGYIIQYDGSKDEKKSGHWVVVTGYRIEDGNFYVVYNDPLNDGPNERSFDDFGEDQFGREWLWTAR